MKRFFCVKCKCRRTTRRPLIGEDGNRTMIRKNVVINETKAIREVYLRNAVCRRHQAA